MVFGRKKIHAPALLPQGIRFLASMETFAGTGKEYCKDFSIFTEEQEMMEDVEDCLANGQKINAIKIYRDKMREIYGTKLGLKECKQYIDTLQDDLKKKGVIK